MRFLVVGAGGIGGYFGGRVMGGTCAISVTLDGDGRVVHLMELHTLLLDERLRPHEGLRGAART